MKCARCSRGRGQFPSSKGAPGYLCARCKLAQDPEYFVQLQLIPDTTDDAPDADESDAT